MRVGSHLPCLVVVLVAAQVQQVQFIHHAQALEHAEISVDGYLIDAGFQALGLLENLFGVEMGLG